MRHAPFTRLPSAIALVALTVVAGAVLLRPSTTRAVSAPDHRLALPGTGPAGTRGLSATVTTGSAGYFDSPGGQGIYSESDNLYGIWARSTDSWGGFFESTGGHGIVVRTTGTAHYDHGAVIEANQGWGVYAKSANNQAVRGEAGDVSGISAALGRVGVVGLGQTRGVYGSSGADSIGVYGTAGSYGAYGYAYRTTGTSRGVYGNTARSDGNYGLYTPDNLYAANNTLIGTISQIMQNGGDEPLEPGDVVVFAGIGPPLEKGGTPVVRVAKAGTVASGSLAGVVVARYNAMTTLGGFDPALEAELADATERNDQRAVAALQSASEPILEGAAERHEFVKVVVQGAAKVRVSAIGGGAIRTGDALTLGATPGRAVRVASERPEEGTAAPRLGTALESVDSGDGEIYVYVRSAG